MLTIKTIDAATRDQVLAPLTDEERARAAALGISEETVRSDRIIALVSQQPLEATEIAACVALGESTDDYRRRRNELFAEAWLARPAITESPAELAAGARRATKITGNAEPVEMLLQIIRWRMSAESLPKLEALLRRLQNPN